MNQIAFLSGLPRTGSTVLGTLLSQHPELHPTGTSVLANHVEYLSGFHFGESLRYDVNDPNSPLWGMLKGMLKGHYRNIPKHTVLDKSRLWSKYVPLLEKTLKEKPKVIATVRPVTEIITSFMVLANKIGPHSQVHETVRQEGRQINEWSLSRVIWERYIYADWRSLKIGLENRPENFLVIDYDDIVTIPHETMNCISEFLGVPTIDFSTKDLSNPVPENDSIYGMPGLHTVRPTLNKVSKKPVDVLGRDCCGFWEDKHLDFWTGKTIEIGTDRHGRS